MEIKKTVIILAASCMMYSCATKTDNNPFFTEFQTEYGVPAFDKIKLEHYEPAFLKGIEEQNQNIKAIIENPEAPTFENTIVALDNSSPILDRVSAIFFNMTDAETTDELTELSIKMAPVLSEHSDNISLNQELFAKVNNVYQQKNDLHLTTEQERLLDKTYKSFVRKKILPAYPNGSAKVQPKRQKLPDKKENGCLHYIMPAVCLFSNIRRTAHFVRKYTRPILTVAITMIKTTTKR